MSEQLAHSVQIYKLDQGYFPHIRRRIIIRALVTYVIIGLIVTAFFWYKMPDIRVESYVIMSLFFLVVVIFALRKAIGRERESWETFELQVTETALTRRIASHPDITLTRDDVQKIEEAANGILVVRGPTFNQTIFIHYALQQREILRALLATWCPIGTITKKRWGPLTSIAIYVAMLGILAGAFASANKIVVTICAILVTGLFSWVAWYIYHCKHYDRRLRYSMWFMIFPVTAALIRAIILLQQ
jgi:hypothetical protein